LRASRKTAAKRLTSIGMRQVAAGETLARGPYVAETFPVHVEDSYVIVET